MNFRYMSQVSPKLSPTETESRCKQWNILTYSRYFKFTQVVCALFHSCCSRFLLTQAHKDVTHQMSLSGSPTPLNTFVPKIDQLEIQSDILSSICWTGIMSLIGSSSSQHTQPTSPINLASSQARHVWSYSGCSCKQDIGHFRMPERFPHAPF